MSVLNKMLLRDILRAKGQFVAAAAVIFVGMTLYVAVNMSYRNLNTSVEDYYRTYHFMDYLVEGRSITRDAARKVEAIPGVKEAQPRYSYDVAMVMTPERKATVRIISLPPQGKLKVNQLVYISGGPPQVTGEHQCAVTAKFAGANGFGVGDKIRIIVDRREQELSVSGVVASPEYIYAIQGNASVFPSDNDFGIVFMPERSVETMFGNAGIFNEIVMTFSESKPTVELYHQIDKTLKPYGYVKSIKRKDQLSYYTVNNELVELDKMAMMFPALFLTVAAMMIYIMEKRIVSNQRTLIGVMKAFGFSNSRLYAHYLGHSFLVALAGTIPAFFIGMLMSKGMTQQYNMIFSLPSLVAEVHWGVIVPAVAFSSGFCLLAGLMAVKHILTFLPAEAMRPEPPVSGRKVLLEYLPWLWQRFNFGWKLSIRNVFRSLQRTGLTALGVLFTIMFFVLTLYMSNMIDYIFRMNYEVFQRHDLQVTFAAPVSFDALEGLRQIDGVVRVEPVMDVPVVISNGWRKQEVILSGQQPNNRLMKLYGLDMRPIQLPSQGILLAESTARDLGVRPGDRVLVKPYYGHLEESRVKIAGIVKQYAGFRSFIDARALGGLTGEGRFATGALLRANPRQIDEVRAELIKMPAVGFVESRQESYQAILNMTQFMIVFIGMMLLFGGIMGFAMIYNTTVINIMERRRELATLKVLGYHQREIENVIFRENMIIVTAALLPGIALGLVVSRLFALSFSNKLFAMEFIIYPSTYGIAVLCVYIFTILAQLANRRGIHRLDMVEVLKGQEG